MTEWIQTGSQSMMEPVTAAVLLVLLVSLIQGLIRGASGSARRLFFFVWESIVIVACLVLASHWAGKLSPVAADMLRKHVIVPSRALGSIEQAWYTLITSIRDFALLRYVLLFLLIYMLLRVAASGLNPLFELIFRRKVHVDGDGRQQERRMALPRQRAASRAFGALLGGIHGAGRAFIFIAVLFVYVSLLPNGVGAQMIKQSPLYTQAAVLLEPVAGDMLAGRGPVLAEAMQAEFQNILQRKYEVIDYAIPADIEQAAMQVVKDARTDEAKARALYAWLGTRIAYDWDKARNYEEQGIWQEQTPQNTFDTRKGVCIDVARLYDMMARAVDVEVRVVTGLGADGKGGFGPHAWNEVRIEGKWLPLDATWASSGDWFNSPDFEQTHIRDKQLSM